MSEIATQADYDLSELVKFDGLKLVLVQKDPTWEECVWVGGMLCFLHQQIQFAIGDFMNEMARIWGDKAFQLDVFSDTKKTLRNMMRVADRVRPNARVKELDWSVHSEVAGLEPDEQDDWLEKSLINDWSNERLRTELKAAGLRKNFNSKGRGPQVVFCPECNHRIEL